MIPISDANPTRRTPIINWLLIAANVVVFLNELTMSNRGLDRFISVWGVNSTNVLAALAHPAQAPIHTWETLITSQFLHAGWLHILGNMLFLWVFGDNIEDVLGSFLYPIFYLMSGVIAGVAQAVVQGPSDLPSIGASGAIAGVLGAYIVLYPWARVSVLFPIFILFTTIQIPALIVIGWWFIQQFFYGVATLSETAAGGVAFWAHIGGFIGGAVMILPFIGRRRGRVRSYYDSTPTSTFNSTSMGIIAPRSVDLPKERLQLKLDEVERDFGAQIYNLLEDENRTRLGNTAHITEKPYRDQYSSRWVMQWKDAGSISYELSIVIRVEDTGSQARVGGIWVRRHASTMLDYDGHTPTTRMRRVTDISIEGIRAAVEAELG